MDEFVSKNYIDSRLRGNDKTNIVFFGTPDFVIPILDSILRVTGLNLVSVVTNPDRPVGRKQILTPTPVKVWATHHSVSVFTPETFDDNFKFEILNLKLDLGILAAYGKIIPDWLINLFPKGILVVHPSLLPKYRGASPVQAAILNGDRETGVTILKMDKKIDHGPIIYQFKIPVDSDETTASLLKKSFNQTANILPEIINRYYFFYPDRGLKSNIQNDKQATYTKLIKKEDGFIHWEFIKEAIKGKTAEEKWSIRFLDNLSLIPDSYNLNNFIRAMTPWPGAWTEIEVRSEKCEAGSKKRLKILKAHLDNEKLVLDEVQLEGKKPTSALPGLF